MDNPSDDIKKLLDRERTKNRVAREVAVEISKNSPLKTKLNSILEILENSYGLQHTLLLFPNKENTALTVFASRGYEHSGMGVEVPFGYGIVGMVAKKRKKIRIAGISYYRKYAHVAAGKRGDTFDKSEVLLPGIPNVEAQLALPLIVNDELIAVLSIESDKKDFFSRDDENFLQSLTQQIALSIQNALIINDLEDRIRERTREVESKNIELEKLNATKNKFFSIIGHDLRSPVSSLKVATDLIQYYSAEGNLPKLEEIGLKVNTAVNNVNQLLDNLLSWAMAQQDLLACNAVKVNVRDVVSRVCDIFKEAIQAKEIKVSNSIEKDCTIMADMDMIMTVFRNVISNAIKFSSAGGDISIKSNSKEDRLAIEITDSGVGMSQQKTESLFNLTINKSTLGTNREKGTGLGMVLVKDFVELNKGTVQVESKIGVGTKVILNFPTI